ncbi:hypothetical protein SAMN05443247_06490 [Bradyrhizobium erythrophlei]|nr:hypothetical protein SAMN05443247_06490 [Bradyrhizobium erythrophlei]
MSNDLEVESELQNALAHAVAPMRGQDCANFLAEQVAVGEVKADFDRTPAQSKDRAFQTNRYFWSDVIAEKIRANTVVELRDFVLTEWIPRSPGTFHTGRARDARREAWSHRIPDRVIQNVRRHDEFISNRIVFNPMSKRGLGHDIAFPRNKIRSGDPPVVFSPDGKLSMIEGGIGCVRLQPVQLRNGECWLLGATSSGVAHEGLIVALNDNLYQDVIEDVASGGLRCERLIGQLRFARTLEAIDFTTGIPKLYLEVDQIDRKPLGLFRRRQKQSCLICAAVGFKSNYEGKSRLYATYASFYSDSKLSLRNAVDWMDEEYIRGMYTGAVVADFDEQSSRFPGAVFGLMKIMRGTINVADANRIVLSVADEWAAERVAKAIERTNSINMEVHSMTIMKTVKIGNNNQISAPITIADTIQGSFNAIASSKEDDQTKALLSQLVRAVAELGPNIPEADAKSLARDADDVVREATGSEPRREVCRSFLNRMGKAAKAIGSVAAPVATVVAAILKFYSD